MKKHFFMVLLLATAALPSLAGPNIFHNAAGYLNLAQGRAFQYHHYDMASSLTPRRLVLHTLQDIRASASIASAAFALEITLTGTNSNSDTALVAEFLPLLVRIGRPFRIEITRVQFGPGQFQQLVNTLLGNSRLAILTSLSITRSGGIDHNELSRLFDSLPPQIVLLRLPWNNDVTPLRHLDDLGFPLRVAVLRYYIDNFDSWAANSAEIRRLISSWITSNLELSISFQWEDGYTLALFIAARVGRHFDPELAGGLLDLLISPNPNRREFHIQDPVGRTLAMIFAENIGQENPWRAERLLTSLINADSSRPELHVQNGEGDTLAHIIARRIAPAEAYIAARLLQLLISPNPNRPELYVRSSDGLTLADVIAVYIRPEDSSLAEGLLSQLNDPHPNPPTLPVQDPSGPTLATTIGQLFEFALWVAGFRPR